MSASANVLLIPGDGIGCEVVAAAAEVLAAAAPDIALSEAQAGWGAFVDGGAALPEETLAGARASDAVLLGAVQSPLERIEGYRSPVVALRRELDLYATVRPVASLPGAAPSVQMCVVRETTEGMYSGLEEANGERATLTRAVTRAASTRVARFALAHARKHGYHRLTIAHKANVLRETCGLFREACLDELEDTDGIVIDERLIDSLAHDLVRHPERFGVIVTTNLFGDVLSDLASALGGGLGLAASASLGERHAIFEPVHGSAPDIAGRGVANPLAAIRAAAMLLAHLRHPAAAAVEAAVDAVLANGPHTPDLGGRASTAEVTEAVLALLCAPHAVVLS